MNSKNSNSSPVHQTREDPACIPNPKSSDSYVGISTIIAREEKEKIQKIQSEEEDEREESEDEEMLLKIDKKLLDAERPEPSARRGSKGIIFGKVAGPTRSLSLNTTTRDKIKIPMTNVIPPPQSAPISVTPPTPPPSSSSSNLAPAASPMIKRSIGAPDSKLVVLGTPSVGKSAIVVRLLTGRFIWEYDPTLEAIYRYHTTVDDEQATIEILDTAGMIDGKVNEGHVRWGDGFLIVYSLTDRSSFLAVPGIHSTIANVKHTPNFPCVILANKSDLVHLSSVCEKEASAQASELGVSFFSASACEGSSTLWEAFSELHRDVVRRYRNRRRKSSAKVVIEGFYKMFTR